MKKLIVATVGVAFLIAASGMAFAQQDQDDDPIVAEQKQKKKDAEEVDKRYKSTLEKTRSGTPAAPLDPWSNMRGSDNSKQKR